jgi:hypothetical protein
MRKPATGEPCAGEPHARFGGRGGGAFPTPIYITLFVDIDQARVLFATEGKDADTFAFGWRTPSVSECGTVAAFAEDVAAHGGDPAAIEEVCIDMSPAFIKDVTENLPNAAITFDKFHAVKIINDAVDQVRRAEQKQQGVLRGTRYIWLRSPDNLFERQRSTLEALPTRHLKTATGLSDPPGVPGSLRAAFSRGRRLPQDMVFLGDP